MTNTIYAEALELKDKEMTILEMDNEMSRLLNGDDDLGTNSIYSILHSMDDLEYGDLVRDNGVGVIDYAYYLETKEGE